jgi:hypothetical protein
MTCRVCQSAEASLRVPRSPNVHSSVHLLERQLPWGLRYERRWLKVFRAQFAGSQRVADDRGDSDSLEMSAESRHFVVRGTTGRKSGDFEQQ